MNTQPTPGSWELDGDEQHIDGIGRVHMLRVVAPNGEVVAEFSNAGCNEIIYDDDGGGTGRHYDVQAMANAMLIAAAPDLKAALCAMVHAWEPEVGGSDYDVWLDAKAALAKARGEST